MIPCPSLVYASETEAAFQILVYTMASQSTMTIHTEFDDWRTANAAYWFQSQSGGFEREFPVLCRALVRWNSLEEGGLSRRLLELPPISAGTSSNSAVSAGLSHAELPPPRSSKAAISQAALGSSVTEHMHHSKDSGSPKVRHHHHHPDGSV